MGPRPPLLHPPLLPLMQTLRRRGEHLRVLKPQMVEVHEARGLPSRVHLRQGYRAVRETGSLSVFLAPSLF